MLHTLSGADVGVWERKLTANTVDVVSWEVGRTAPGGFTVQSPAGRRVTVVNVDGAAPIYVRGDGQAPTVGGSSSYWLPAVAGASLTLSASSVQNPDDASEWATRVQLVSAGTPSYSVMEER